MNWKNINITEANKMMKDYAPSEIVKWVLSREQNAVITTNFRPYEAAILHAVTHIKSCIKVIWCDTGYNTPNTYRCAEKIISQLDLNMQYYVPKQTVAHRNILMGIPDVDDQQHTEFTYQVKLEPFTRAFEEHKPKVWFTNLRKGQTALRDNLDILSVRNDGILKVSPFYYYSDQELERYLESFNLPNEHKYYDPTKALAHRECGLHQLK